MTKLPFNLDLLVWIVDHRIGWLTKVFLFFTFMGSEFGYIILILGCYWLYDKKFAIRLTLLTIATSYLNHLIKITIRNPRPFVTEGTYGQNWAISSSQMEETAEQFSTPSGHAMGSASFWPYVHHRMKSKVTRILVPVMIIMIGLSRPYLGVHYLEDVILGWILGLIVVFLIITKEEKISNWWNNYSNKIKYLIIVAVSVVSWLLAGLYFDFGVDGKTFATFGGMITGLIIGSGLETDKINFDEKPSSIANGLIRFLVGIVPSVGILFGLDIIFEKIAEDLTPLGYLLRYIRYTSLGLVATFGSSYLFVKLKISKSQV